jgi:ABC-type phosphate transport system substrate-binding protein
MTTPTVTHVTKGLLFALFLFAGATGARAQIAVVVHPTAPVQQLDARALLDIYSLEETRWDDGTPIILHDLKGKHPVKQSFYDFIGRRPEDMKRVWLRIILSGEARSPTLLRSEQALLDKVAGTPGSIGYVPLALVTDAVKVVATIQDLPRQ